MDIKKFINRRSGFSLTELLVATVIMGFVFIILSAVQLSVTKANKRTINNGLTALQATGLLKDMKNRIGQASFIDMEPSSSTVANNSLFGYMNLRSTEPFVAIDPNLPPQWFKYCTTDTVNAGVLFLYKGEGEVFDADVDCGSDNPYEPYHRFNISDKWNVGAWFRRPADSPHVIEFDTQIISKIDGSSVTYQTTYHAQSIPFYYVPTDDVTLTYNGMGATSDTPPQTTHLKGDTVTLSALIPKKTTNPKNFSGWSARADGGGVSYQPGAQYTITHSITMYAQWTN